MNTLGQAGVVTRPAQALRRNWLHLTPRLSGAPCLPLRVLSYNLLAPCYMHKKFFPHSLQEHLHWPARSNKILEEIRNLNWPQVLSFQEYQKIYSDSLRESLGREGYAHLQGFKRGKQEGLAVYYKEDTFSLLWHSYLDLNLSRQLRAFPKFDFETCGLLCLLQSRQHPAQHFLVVNTHLLFSPLKGNEKVAQLVVLLKAIAKVRLAFSPLRIHVLFNGDFNFLPCSALYSFMVDGLLFPGQFSEKHYSGQLANQHLPLGLSEAQHFWRSTRRVAPLKTPQKDQTLFHNLSRIQLDLDHTLRLRMGEPGCSAISFQDGALRNALPFRSAYSAFHREYARRKGLSAEGVVNKYVGQLENRQDLTWESPQTQMASSFRATVDYIWTLDAAPSSIYQALDYTPRSFPNEDFPSDHLALCSDLVFPL